MVNVKPTGYYGCNCHPFDSWAECDAAHKQVFSIGDFVQTRCKKKQGIVIEPTDNKGFCLVRFGPRESDIEQENSAALEPITNNQ